MTDTVVSLLQETESLLASKLGAGAEILDGSMSSSSSSSSSTESPADAMAVIVGLARRVRDLALRVEGPEVADLYRLELERAHAAQARELQTRLADAEAAAAAAQAWEPRALASSLGGLVWNATVKAYDVVSSATHHLTVNRRSVGPGVYSQLETEQMRTIHEYYTRYVGPDIPLVLAVTGTDYSQSAVEAPPKARTFHLRSWQHRLGAGPFRSPAYAALAAVCSYQVERHSRLAGAGYLDDPTNLLLAELKTWLVDEFSVAEPASSVAVDAVHSRIAFLRDLVAADIFPVGSTSKIHLVTVLECVIAKLTDALGSFTPDAVAAASVPLPPPLHLSPPLPAEIEHDSRDRAGSASSVTSGSSR